MNEIFNEVKKPLVSVLMPAYNAEKYISEAIESILNQTFKDFEFIIVDDCSTDGTWRIVQDYAKKDLRIIPIRNDVNSKISATLNKGIMIARGIYLARMDADDWSYPDRFEKQVQFMESHPEVGVSGGTMEVCDAELSHRGFRRYNLKDEDIRLKIFYYSPFCHPLVIFRKAIIIENNILYGLVLSGAEDYDLYFRIGLYSKFANIPDTLLKYRVLPTSTSVSKARTQEYLTLYIRLKAVFEYGYKMSTLSGLYSFFQFLSTFAFPPKAKIFFFNLLRNKK